MSVASVVVNEGNSTELQCQLSDPFTSVSFQWERNGEIIPNKFFAVLPLPSVQLADRGEYTCVATNDAGTDRATGYVTVQCELNVHTYIHKCVCLYVLTMAGSSTCKWTYIGLVFP